MKIKDVKDFIDRECHIDLAIVVSVTEGKSSKGSKYLSLVLQDSTGTIDAKKWDASPSDEVLLGVKKVVALDGYPLMYNGNQLQYKINDYEPVYTYNEEKNLRIDAKKMIKKYPNDYYKVLTKLLSKGYKSQLIKEILKQEGVQYEN